VAGPLALFMIVVGVFFRRRFVLVLSRHELLLPAAPDVDPDPRPENDPGDGGRVGRSSVVARRAGRAVNTVLGHYPTACSVAVVMIEVDSSTLPHPRTPHLMTDARCPFCGEPLVLGGYYEVVELAPVDVPRPREMKPQR
jgi:hypothetical protein